MASWLHYNWALTAQYEVQRNVIDSLICTSQASVYWYYVAVVRCRATYNSVEDTYVAYACLTAYYCWQLTKNRPLAALCNVSRFYVGFWKREY